MQKVTGIGGFFFRSSNPKALSIWYQEKLGVNWVGENYDQPGWEQTAGPTVFSPFPQSTGYFGKDKSKMWMLNFRVENLDAMVAQLTAAGISVEVDPENYPHGRFAHLYDPEENKIELWEPGE